MGLKVIQKQENSPLKMESLIFGQAGLLNENLDLPYYTSLKLEYEF